MHGHSILSHCHAHTTPPLRGDITYSSAKDDETNILHKLTYWDQRVKFFSHLYKNRSLTQAVTAHHLGLSSKETCRIAEPDDWVHGSFNLCIPVAIDNWRKHPGKRVIIRFPLPYRVGEAFCPGNVDEKLRCEAGAYAWLQEKCPTVPIPHLYGFGLSTGQSLLKTFLLLPAACNISRRQNREQIPDNLGTGYLLIEYIEEAQGRMLSCTWNEKRHETKLRRNLSRNLSRILLTLSRMPLPLIGSFIIDDNGLLRLQNRPLSLEIHDLENEHILVHISRSFTYSTVDSYVVDILAFHDRHLHHQPNAINNVEDGLFQMTALTIMKTTSSQFFRRDLWRGPFVFTLTDLHQSNMFVDENWNIEYLVDLEWACSRPVEMLHPPYWLTSQPVDEIDMNEYEKLHEEFMDAFEEEKKICEGQQILLLTPILKQAWKMGIFWYSLALDSPTGLFRLFYDHIQPRFAKEHMDDAAFFRITMSYWSTNASKFLPAKVNDKEHYDMRLREAFED